MEISAEAMTYEIEVAPWQKDIVPIRIESPLV